MTLEKQTSAAVGEANSRRGQKPKKEFSSRGGRPLKKPAVLTIQIAIVSAALVLWELAPHLPLIGGRWNITDPFFISSPTRVWDEIVRLATDGTLGSALWTSMYATLIGTTVGLALGALAGLAMSNSVRMSQIFRPFAVAINAIPRIALIPIIIIMVGANVTASIVGAILVVFFVGFFAAYEGGLSVPVQLIQNAHLLGAKPAGVMRKIRLPYVLAWTFANLPLAITFGLISVVTTEILTGTAGMGRLITDSISLARSTLTFAAVVVLSVVGLTIVLLAEAAKRKVLHWWVSSDQP